MLSNPLHTQPYDVHIRVMPAQQSHEQAQRPVLLTLQPPVGAPIIVGGKLGDLLQLWDAMLMQFTTQTTSGTIAAAPVISDTQAAPTGYRDEDF